MMDPNFSLQYPESTHPDRCDVLDILVEKHSHLQDKAWEAQKTEHVTLDDSIPVA